MADSFGGVVLNTLMQNAGLNNARGASAVWVPQWEQQANVTVRHIPFSNSDDIQGAGRSNFSITIKVRVTNNNDVTTLQGLVGTTPGTLVLYGVTYSTAYLIKVGRPEMMGLPGSAEWAVELTFMRAGS